MEKLSKQPLIEVIFEFHWFNKRSFTDPQYRFLIGSLYESLRDKFSKYEILPTANIPPETLPHDVKIVQYRFKNKDYGWPVVQLGPGILTVNMNENYDTWDKFKPVIEEVLAKFLKSYTEKESLGIDKLILKYIDAFDFKKDTEDVLNYLKEKLHTTVELSFGDDTRKNLLKQTPKNLEIRLEYEVSEPKGFAGIRFLTVPIKGRDHLIMESFVVSDEIVEDVELSYVSNWLDKAHNITDFIFSSLIRGSLMEELK